jgi:hypothetical protein
MAALALKLRAMLQLERQRMQGLKLLKVPVISCS